MSSVLLSILWFIFLIDEWDCLFREYKDDTGSQKKYLDFLRNLLKDQPYVALAYMTGFLPVKKYGTHPALNMFDEYSMINPAELVPYFGFTEEEVRLRCEENCMSFEEARARYDGYQLYYRTGAPGKKEKRRISVCSPKSMVTAIMNGEFDAYWNMTETYEALKIYIGMNFDGLRGRIVRMIAGEKVPVDSGTFTNDMTTFATADDVMSLPVHLGYLSYEERTVRIPNREVSIEFTNAIRVIGAYSEVSKSIEASKALLTSLLEGDSEAVSAGLARAHEEISILTYNDENSLSCAITLAFYYAREYYTVPREMPCQGRPEIAIPSRNMKPTVGGENRPTLTARRKGICGYCFSSGKSPCG